MGESEKCHAEPGPEFNSGSNDFGIYQTQDL